MDKPIVFIMNDNAHALGLDICKAVNGDLAGLKSRCEKASIQVENAGEYLQTQFTAGRAIIAVMASGALIRILAPVLKSKHEEPPVLCVSEDGKSVVPLLGGHHGANDLAREIGSSLGSHAAITTAGDIKFGIALDEPPAGYVLANPHHAKGVMARLVAGESAQLLGANDWLEASAISFDAGADIRLITTCEPAQGDENTLVYHPKTHVLGMGCERGTEPEEAIDLAKCVIEEARISPQAIAMVTSIDLKADETALHAVASHLGVPIRFFDAATLETHADRLANPSDIVFAEVGCHGVAEGAALAGAGQGADLVIPKQKSKRATAALGSNGQIIDIEKAGRSRGRICVVGIGPGSADWRSPDVTQMICSCSDIVGYSLYLDLIDDIGADKIRHDFDLGREEDRVRHAMELAGEGRDVALVCSGDAGIYAMATLVFELLEKGGLSDGAQRIKIDLSPGISALQGAAARAGAPLGHDFCTISLSDLLTPWEDIQRRVTAAGEGDFVIAFYNPVSRKRRTQLAWARDKLLEFRPAQTPVILATNLGREGELVRVVELAQLQVDEVDMLTVVIIGSSNSSTVKTGDGREWVYTPRGYARKKGTGMIESVVGAAQ